MKFDLEKHEHEIRTIGITVILAYGITFIIYLAFHTFEHSEYLSIITSSVSLAFLVPRFENDKKNGTLAAILSGMVVGIVLCLIYYGLSKYIPKTYIIGPLKLSDFLTVLLLPVPSIFKRLMED